MNAHDVPRVDAEQSRAENIRSGREARLYYFGTEYSVPAEVVRCADGRWRAVRLDGKTRWCDAFKPPPPDRT